MLNSIIFNNLKKFFPVPAWCFGCKEFLDDNEQSFQNNLCHDCFEKLPFISNEFCLICEKHHSSGNCTEKYSESINKFKAIFWYDEPVKDWVSQLKYAKNLSAGKILQLLIEYWFNNNKDFILEHDLLLCIPIHWRRFISRGFNQTEYLLLRQNLIKLKPNLIKKTKHTAQQAGLSLEKRVDNIKDSFYLQDSLDGKKILLFDDVSTTGQTINEVSKIIKKAGAKNIDVLTLCRTDEKK